MTNRIAAIDLGTNTARLLIADKHGDGTFTPICLERRVVRLGGGFSREQGLSPEAVQRGMSCLELFSRLIREHGAHHVRAVATSAVRDAVNGPDFRRTVHSRTHIALTIIDGVLEGKLTLAGVMAGLDCRPGSILLFDVGGGSTEYTLVENDQAKFIRSLPLGVVRLTEGKGSLEAMDLKISKELKSLLQEMQAVSCRVNPECMLIGTAGTATTLAAISLSMEDYDYRRVNNLIISRDEIDAIFHRLLPLSLSERLKVPGLEQGREDLIIAGCMITLKTMALFGMETMKVSDYGLLEGLIVSDDLPDV